MTVLIQKQPPATTLTSGAYSMRFAQTPEELDRIFRLRYLVFNLELNEGLDESHATGRDQDGFDTQCHHILVSDDRTGECVGTYRLQTNEMASEGIGFYSATEFDLSQMPIRILSHCVEAGRACIDSNHRTLHVLHLLWKGLGAYMSHTRKRYLFGCCSLTSQLPDEGLAMLSELRRKGHVVENWSVSVQPDYVCHPTRPDQIKKINVKIPRLMNAYLAQGARICSPPAIDRSFKTIDFLALFDVGQLSSDSQAYYGVAL